MVPGHRLRYDLWLPNRWFKVIAPGKHVFSELGYSRYGILCGKLHDFCECGLFGTELHKYSQNWFDAVRELLYKAWSSTK